MHKDIKFRWVFDEYNHYERGTLWYVVAGLVVGGLLVYSIATNNLLFAVLIFLAIMVIFIRQIVKPQKVTCEIHTNGIALGSKFYTFSDLEYFSIIENTDGETVLYIHEARGLKSLVPIPMPDEQADKVHRFLSEYVEENEEQEYEPFWEWIMRRLKL